MRCTSYCTAASYDIILLLNRYQSEGMAQLFRDAVYVSFLPRFGEGEAFFFCYGVVVFWGLNEDQEAIVLEEIHPFEVEPSKAERDDFSSAFGDSMSIESDEIILHNPSVLLKLAIGYALGQSVKLTTFEEMIHKTVEQTKHLPVYLAKAGKIPLSRKTIAREMGKIISERWTITLQSDILDTPEFFWHHPELEPFYRKTANYLEVTKRGDVLDKKLMVLRELFEILSGELNYLHSFRLEVIIIILILIEVVFAVGREFFY